jgi:hypothetical protein
MATIIKSESVMLRSPEGLGKSVLLPGERSTVEVSTILKSLAILQSPPRSVKIGYTLKILISLKPTFNLT